jgi:putative hemolysin
MSSPPDIVAGAVWSADRSEARERAFLYFFGANERLGPTLQSPWPGARYQCVALELCVIAFLILLNGVLAGAEIAVISAERTRLTQLVERGDSRARAVSELRRKPERFFAAVQIGITLIGATAAAFGGSRFSRHFEPALAEIAFLKPVASQLSFVIVVVVISFLSVVFGELVPKSIAVRHAHGYALATGRLILGLSWVTGPLVWLFSVVSNAVLRLFGMRTNVAENQMSAEDLQLLVSEASESGSLDPTAGEIAHRAIEFADLTAAEVMVPRSRMVGISECAGPGEIRRVVTEHAYSRFPIYGDGLDDIRGYVLVKDLLSMAFERELIIIQDFMRTPYFVAEGIKAPELLQEMRRRRTHLAFVVDEHGGTSGIVTMEDLLEELVGEMFSEIAQEPSSSIHELSDGSAVAHGDTPLRTLNRQLGIELPESDEWSTLGGLCLSLAGRIPKQGQRLASPDGTGLEIQSATERRVERVRLWPSHRNEAA